MPVFGSTIFSVLPVVSEGLTTLYQWSSWTWEALGTVMMFSFAPMVSTGVAVAPLALPL